MIEIIERRHTDDIMSVGVYISIAVHTVAVLSHGDNITIYLLPGGVLTLWGWGAVSVFSALVCLAALLLRSLELERAGLTALTTCMIGYTMSGFVIIEPETYPGRTTSWLALTMSLVMAHFLLKLNRQISMNKSMEKLVEKNEHLKKGLTKEAD